MDQADIVIIGAGVVGLALAAELSAAFGGGSIIVLERRESFGRETSSRNSEVIHAGMYYPAGSLKARLCVEGNRLLYDFCRRHDVPHRRMGKLIVATDESENEQLETLLARGRANGIHDLSLIECRDIARLEPHIRACAALLSPSTGVVDTHRLMARMETLALQNGVSFAYRHDVLSVRPGTPGNTVVYTTPGGQAATVDGRWVINAGGLSAERIAATMGIDCLQAGYRLYPCKGEYFRIPAARARLVSRLVYPTPYADLRGLGVHVTKTLDGTVRLGPNALYVDSCDYAVDPAHAREFYEGAKKFLPFLEPGDLQPDTAGIRPKLQAPGTPARDFVICHETGRGLRGIINLVGIESPGLTSCLSIARMVRDMIEQDAA
jgi:L-2-hydroxyglutarate oxidase LhgO